ncbi:MAG TPA: GGDEF domain-containing protein, partial [Gemmatimonadaceae bacterium]|nr:GGDEF domain-containing protein [Gemmatimonadaceae bacterium]
MTTPDRRQVRPNSTADILLWQSRVRLLAAVVLGAAGLALQALGAIPGSSGTLIQGLVGYIAAVAVTYVVVRETGRVSPVVVGGTIAADLFLVFAATLISSAPDDYVRALVLSFFAVHMAVYAFGERTATVPLFLSALGYLWALSRAAQQGADVHWADEVWTVGLYLVAGGTFVHLYGGMSARLRRLVDLFERAEEGDFADLYDVSADPRPDAVTAVGDAYNRVREQLSSMVLTDPLTNCLNRRGFEQSLARELSRAGRAGSEVALLAVDLDHFKTVNDTRGHLVGDA